MKTVCVALVASTLLLAACGGSGSGGDGPPPGEEGSVYLSFVSEINGEPFACGREFTNVGTSAATVEPSDLRFYVSNLRFIREDGAEEPFVLEQDNTWQLENLALLDFEDGTGRCSLAGSTEMNKGVRGTLPPAEYTGVRFTLGVPFERNHGDAATAPSPLNKSAMFWNWNAGYKFLRFDNWVESTGEEFRGHVGSTRCEGDGRGNVTGCDAPNRVEVELLGFDPKKDAIVADFGVLLADSDVEVNAPDSPPGCMGGSTDADCVGPFGRLGIPFGGHPGGTQQVFRVGPDLAQQPEPTPPPPTPTPPGSFAWDLPEGFPVPAVPADNPMSQAKVELGRFLFYDTKLSLNETQACGSCHQQERAFTDAREVALGSTGEHHPRNAQPLGNVAFVPTLTWMNPLLARLEDQILIPLFGEEPVELGFAGREDELLRRLSSDARYSVMFADAFPEDPNPISVGNLTKAIAAFERTLISGNSPFDRYVYQGDENALSEAAKRGMGLFFSELLECDHCHGGLNFAGALTHEGNPRDTAPFENDGLYNIGGTGAYPEPNTGRFAFTGDPRDMGRMKPPSLRNVELTAPYMHDGSIRTLEEVVDHYERGGRLIESGPLAGEGAASRVKSEFITGFPFSDTAKADLIEFLKSLTDQGFVTDHRFSDPFAAEEAE